MCRKPINLPVTSHQKKDDNISFREVQAHNTPKSAWCTVRNGVYDITEFAKRHPGGDVILLAAGRDATVLFETYHPRGVSVAYLNKLQIGKVEDLDSGPKGSFYSWDSEFYTVLRNRVVERLEKLELPRRGGHEIAIKAFVLLSGFWLSLIKMYFAQSFFHAVPWAILMGLFASFVGTCIQHDGNHGAFSENKTVNKIAGWTLDMIGASAFTWEIQHMLGHHPYTNLLDTKEDIDKEAGMDSPVCEKDQESDPDVFSSFPAMRMHPFHKPSWIHKYQHIYAPFLFALMTLSKVFQQDFDVAINKRLFHIDASCRYESAFNVIRFWCMKVITTIYMLFLPCYFHGIKSGLILFLTGHLVCGEMLATMFIVNHVIEGVCFAQKDMEKNKLKPSTINGVTPMEKTSLTSTNTHKVPLNDWAAVQCQTSVNWSSGSWFWNHFSGGLCHQIEHHLFPSICHTNYVHIQDVVENTCKEYGVPYRSETNLFVAYTKMMKHLKLMGHNENKTG